MKIIGLLVSLATFQAVLFAQTKAPETVILTGRLVGGQVAIGGETTGWVLRYRDEKGPRSIEVAFTKALPRTGARRRQRPPDWHHRRAPVCRARQGAYAGRHDA